MTKELKALTDLDTLEVSLLRQKRGAQGARFAIEKSEEEVEEMEEILKAVLELELDNEDEIKKVFKKADISAKGQGALIGAVRLLNSFKDELPKDAMSVIAKLSGLDLPVTKEVHVETPEEKKKREEEEAKMAKAKHKDKKYPFPFKKEDGTLDLSGVPEEMRPGFEILWKQNDDLVKKNEALSAKSDETAKILKEERDQRLEKEWIAKAENDFPFIPGSSEDNGKMLKSLSDSDPDAAKAIVAKFEALNEQIASSALFQEHGSGRADGSSTAMQRIEKAAEELQKSDPKLSKSQAIVQITKASPDLTAAYYAEKAVK